MDLGKIDYVAEADAGAEMTLIDPATGGTIVDDTGAPCVIILAGADSNRYKRAHQALSDRNLQKARTTPPTAEGIEQDTMSVLAACFIDWRGFTRSGEPVKCDKNAAIELMTKAPFVREQVAGFINNRANFMRG